MAGIGNYIHARRRNYLLNSTTLDDWHFRPPSPSQIYAQHIQDMRQEVHRSKFSQTPKERDRLEKMLNIFFHPAMRTNISRGQLNQADVAAMEQAVTEYIEKKFNSKVNIDFNTLSVISDLEDANLNKHQKNLLDKVASLRKFQESTSHSIENIEKSLQAFIKFRKSIGDNSRTKIDANIYNKMLALEKSYKQFKKDVNIYRQKTGNQKNIGNLWLSENTEGKRIDQEINDLLDIVKNATTRTGNIEGELGEVSLAAMNYVLNHKGRASAKKLLAYLEEGLDRSTKSHKGVKSGNISWFASYYKNQSARYNSKGEEILYTDLLLGDQFSATLTEDKVDLTMNLKEFGETNLSIKNYDLSSSSHRSFKLLEGRNLLALVQDYDFFVNHFLNIVGTHSDSNFPRTDITTMHQAMKITIFVKALIGGVYTDTNGGSYSQAVDLFVVNDKSTGGYKVYYISELLDKVENSTNNLLYLVDYPNNIWSENAWIPPKTNDIRSSAIRITRLVNRMRDMKLKVFLRFDALQ